MYDLKPCPFCGSKRVAVSETMSVNIPYYVRCCTCECRTMPFETEVEAVRMWNTRKLDLESAQPAAQ